MPEDGLVVLNDGEDFVCIGDENDADVRVFEPEESCELDVVLLFDILDTESFGFVGRKRADVEFKMGLGLDFLVVGFEIRLVV